MDVAGLELVGEDGIMQPLAAVACVKGLDADGNVAYVTRATEGVTTVEAMGMAAALLDDLRNSRREG